MVGSPERCVTAGAGPTSEAPLAYTARRAQRISVDGRVELRGFFAHGAREERVVDASPYGVFVETAAVLEVGDPIVLSLALGETKRLRVSGRVRWVTPFGRLDDARPGMGIELVGLSAEAGRELHAQLGLLQDDRRRAQRQGARLHGE